MTRLIDADALMRDIERYHLSDGKFQHWVEVQPTVDTKPHWIPCSERLPEIRQWVLCQCRAGIMDILRLTADGSWYNGYPETEYMGGFVVAWMPLPKTYEGDKE